MKFIGRILGFGSELDNGLSGAAKTIVVANGQKQKLTLNNPCTVTLDSTGLPVGSYQLRLVQDATGARAVTWAGISDARWLGATTAPAINAAANGETIVTFYWDGANFTQSLAKVGAA